MTTSLSRLSMATSPCATGATTALERTRFFPRQLVGPDDFTQDQTYFREKLRRHNRMLHGWGIVCGACVRRGQTACEVIIEPGYILGPWGDEIVIDKEVVVDLCKQGTGERMGCCGDAPDPWCADPRAECPDGTVYLAVRYAECQARPVRASASACGCGCDDGACEYSRIRDSYAVKVLRDLPSSYDPKFQQPPIANISPCQRGGARACTPCATEPWVIVADITVGSDCSVRAINCFAHRRMVVSFADFFFTCKPQVGGVLAPPANTGFLHTLSMMSGGTSELVDVRSATTGAAPRATVTLRREDGSAVMLPMFFTVNAGDTVDTMLAREGDRELYDPATDTTLTLRDVYASAGVAGSTKLDSALGALAPLDGSTLRSSVPQPPGSRATLQWLLDQRGVDRLAKDHGDDVARAPELPATDLAGVSPRSELGKRLAGSTIADVATLSRDDFLTQVVKLSDIPARRRKEVETQAIATWSAAQRVKDLRG